MRRFLIKLYSWFGYDKFKVGIFFLLIFFVILSLLTFHPEVSGDSVSYVQAIDVLKTDIRPVDFIPYRIITTYLGLQSIIFFDAFIGNLLASWLLLNSLLYITMGMFFYSLLLKVFVNPKTAFLGTLFLAANYDAVVFSFHYLMDVGGWAFYVVSIYFSFLYLENKENKWLWLSALLVGLGGLFKEYAFLAYVVIFGLIVYINWKQWLKIIKLTFLSGLLAFGPIISINIYSFVVYQYTYLSWFLYAQDSYVYQSRLIEYIKSFGSLYNFGWFLFLGGAYLLLKRTKEILKDEKILFIWLIILSAGVVFVWPVVTRVLFITMPALVIVTSLYIQKLNKLWPIVLILVLYTLISYLMDAYILDMVNIDRFFAFILSGLALTD